MHGILSALQSKLDAFIHVDTHGMMHKTRCQIITLMPASTLAPTASLPILCCNQIQSSLKSNCGWYMNACHPMLEDKSERGDTSVVEIIGLYLDHTNGCVGNDPDTTDSACCSLALRHRSHNRRRRVRHRRHRMVRSQSPRLDGGNPSR